jgi:hypothetical protein
LNGYGGGRFGVNDSVTRDQLAATIHHYALLAGLDAGGRSCPRSPMRAIF